MNAVIEPLYAYNANFSATSVFLNPAKAFSQIIKMQIHEMLKSNIERQHMTSH